MAQVLMVVLALSSSSPSASSACASPGDSVGILHPLAVIGEGPVVAEGMETAVLSPMDAARLAVESFETLSLRYPTGSPDQDQGRLD